MLSDALEFETIPRRMEALRSVGVPYTDADVSGAVARAREQAGVIAAEVASQGGPKGLEDKQIVALVAYLQRLGQDIKAPPPAAASGAGAGAGANR
jgi:cytochrome c oxidase cbb3-type subunit I/II